jgi:hypothetical protein
VYIAHNTTVEKCVSEMKQNMKLKTKNCGTLVEFDKESHLEITNFSVLTSTHDNE